ncbi:MAG: hypothetical protein FJ278_13380, partial [Planctomycetes bacterium]|nr:hypothetical protein [Planctomycetota bacterium]
MLLLIVSAASCQLRKREAAPPEQAAVKVDRYVDPAQLDVPWPKHSHLKQPWRAYLETVPGVAFLDGLGINYNLPHTANHDVAMRMLAEHGFRRVRIEIGWGSVRRDETTFNNAADLAQRLQACKKHGLRPLILLNAHHGWPCPMASWEAALAADAPEGSREIALRNEKDAMSCVPHRTAIFRLGVKDPSHNVEDIFITSMDSQGKGTLSRPLPVSLKAGQKVAFRVYKYLPAHPVGTPEFEQLAEGWLRYARLVTDFVVEQGIEDFDLELWNELSFGSAFMGGKGINHYYDPPKAQFTAK